MSSLSKAKVESALKGWTEPNLQTDLISAGALRNLSVSGGEVELELELGFPADRYGAELAKQLRELLLAVPGVDTIKIEIDWKITAHTTQHGVEPITGVSNTIAVASAKGGVGKSTVAVNFALALAAEGARVGLLDADIYGPSQPRMLGAEAQPESTDGKTMEPVMSHGIQSMSIGYLVDDDSPMVWRGPMVTQALQQLLRETRWRDLDYLVIDLPPGTGDIQLTLSQRVPVSGAVIVTTPQDIALIDALKGLRMFEKVQVPVLGLVENMSTHVCGQCGHEESIFGHGGGARMAADNGVELLGELPLDIRIRENVDNGTPSVVAEPDSPVAAEFRSIARRTAAKLSQRQRSYAHAFPKIVVSND